MQNLTHKQKGRRLGGQAETEPGQLDYLIPYARICHRRRRRRTRSGVSSVFFECVDERTYRPQVLTRPTEPAQPLEAGDALTSYEWPGLWQWALVFPDGLLFLGGG
ncbi:hypothetical protein ES708_21586 [subsurface metagenome]